MCECQCSRCVGSGESGGVLHVTVRVRERELCFMCGYKQHTHRPVTSFVEQYGRLQNGD